MFVDVLSRQDGPCKCDGCHRQDATKVIRVFTSIARITDIYMCDDCSSRLKENL